MSTALRMGLTTKAITKMVRGFVDAGIIGDGKLHTLTAYLSITNLVITEDTVPGDVTEPTGAFMQHKTSTSSGTGTNEAGDVQGNYSLIEFVGPTVQNPVERIYSLLLFDGDDELAASYKFSVPIKLTRDDFLMHLVPTLSPKGLLILTLDTAG